MKHERVLPDIVIEPLDPSHDRGAFCCGNDIIDQWCRERATTEHNKYRTRVFVGRAPDSQRVLGFYSLSVRSLAPKTLLGIGFGNRDIPGIYLAMLGVCERSSGTGIGGALMIDAFRRALRVAEEAGTYCLWLTAVDEAKAEWYSRKQFLRIEEGLEMYLPLDTIRDAFAAA